MQDINIARRTIGINFNQGKASIRIWSPKAKEVAVVLTDTGASIPLQQDGELGYWETETDQVKEGTLYKLSIDGETVIPDPASIAQPQGVHGPSQALDLASFEWTDQDWNNHPLDKYLLYELHTGTFTPEGTFVGMGQKLDYLKELGVNAIEIMPVAQFPGSRNWGYDGVYPFAVQHSYGGAKGLQQLVDLCHSKGIAVVLDVVYNHLGPEGNYLGAAGPYFTEKYKTPWGNALNFDDEWCDGVRDYFIENALMWFRDFHIDALRLDAIHAIKDFSPLHILNEIRLHTDRLMRETGRKHYFIAELDLNDTKFINPVSEGGYGLDAQWIDEFHHALRVASGNEKTGYYSDFNGIGHLAKSYLDAYVYDGQFSPHRKKKFGVKAARNPGHQFVVFSQNHDQVGNRMLGERTGELVSLEMRKLLAGAVLLSPYLPMLFMGEEWSETNPFLYFVSHTDPELAEAVRKGRKEEFAAFHAQGEAPDPMSEDTFTRSKLQWRLLEQEPHSIIFNLYKRLIDLRKTHPALYRLERRQTEIDCQEENGTLVLHRWHEVSHVACFMNFSAEPRQVTAPAWVQKWKKALDSASPEWGGPHEAPNNVAAGQAITLQPESFILYTNNHE
jgi:maltooligosyltrehalose trehalohydrolase